MKLDTQCKSLLSSNRCMIARIEVLEALLGGLHYCISHQSAPNEFMAIFPGLIQ